jgi:hypothetical protein
MKRMAVSAALLSVSILLLAGSLSFLALRVSAAGSVRAASALPQAQIHSIRTLPNLDSITIWGNTVSAPGGSGQSAFTFASGNTRLTTRPPDPLGPSNADFTDAGSYCDVFYSNADGALNPDGAYLTIEAVYTSQSPKAGGLNVAEVELNFTGPSGVVENGYSVASFVVLGDNAKPDSIGNAIDGDRHTATEMGNTAGQSQRLRITIGFLSSSGLPCAYRISPTNKNFGSIGGQGTVAVTAPPGCPWTAVSNARSWVGIISTKQETDSGNGVVSYSVAQNSYSDRVGTMTIAGHIFTISQNPAGDQDSGFEDHQGRCAFSVSTTSSPHAETTLSTARRFRDGVLAQSVRGQKYTDLYYRFSTEAVQVMMFNPMLTLRSREMVKRYEPVIQSMVEGKETVLTEGDLDEIESFLTSFATKGGVDFQEAVKGVCRDLRDPQVQSEFGITLTDGPRRELPAAQATILRFGGAGIVMTSVGLSLVAALRIKRRSRNLDRRSRAIPFRVLLALKRSHQGVMQ